jgi:ferredoxin-nitrate reductase
MTDRFSVNTDGRTSTCSYCGVGCGVIVRKTPHGGISVEGDENHPVNRGMLCSKGLNLHYTVMDHTDRLLFPRMRMSRNHPLERTSWDAALDRTATVFRSIIKRYGPDAVAFYISGQCLTEEYYLINKLMKGFIGSNNIDTNSRLCMSTAVTAYKLSLGEDAVPLCYDDIDEADCFYIAGANPAWCHPILYRRIERQKSNNPDCRIIVADPRRTQSCDLADIHLQLRPGTDITLNHAIGRCLIENGGMDENFIRLHTDGFPAYRETVMKRSIDEAASICGVPADDIIKTAAFIGASRGFISLWAMGLNQSVVGVDKNLSLINLSLITGKIGKPGNGPFSLTGQPNAMGGREVGGMCNLLPNHRNLDDPAHRHYVQKFWGGGEIRPEAGLSATEMFDALDDGRLRAIWIVCTNPLVSLPDVRTAERALTRARFVVVQDISSRSDTLPYADVALPAAGWAEKEGTMTNSERRISYLNRIAVPPGEALPDAEIIIRFARKMGFGRAFDYPDIGEVFDEHCRLSGGTNNDMSGLTWSLIKQKGTVHWPFRPGDRDGTSRLFTDRVFHTPTGRAHIHAAEDANGSEPVDDRYPLILTTGRIRDQWHTMTRTGKVARLSRHIPDPFLEMHPHDAEQRGIADNDLAEISGRRGLARVRVRTTDSIRPGVVFLPMHWGKIAGADDARANNLTNNLIDHRSKEPDFKFSAVEVKRYAKPRQKILVVGAGAAAFAFVTRYRELNRTDDIEIFSDEPHPFYNRVLLPEYIAGRRSWVDLQKAHGSFMRDLNLTVRPDTGIRAIDSAGKTATDAAGTTHGYDHLVLATGSSPNFIKNIPRGLDGVLGIRSRADAERLIGRAAPESRIAVIGGGLLGLELAGSLREKGADVTVIHRTSRLMQKQLDATGSMLLHEELTDRGIRILYNEEVQFATGTSSIDGVRLKSGRHLACSALVMAIGITPNMGLARAGGLECRRGVVVNQRMQTSDPSVFAIGEIAEYDHTLYGITAAAEEQAGIAARVISGDRTAVYRGSVQMNVLKIPGIELCSIGAVHAPPTDTECEEVVFIDKSKRYYKKCIVRRDRLVGAILIGDRTEFPEFLELIRDGIELSERRLGLLRAARPRERADGRLICSCNNVGEGNILKRMEAGMRDIQSICDDTGAGTGCGSCKPEIRELIERHKTEYHETA